MGNKCCASCLSSKDQNTLDIRVLSSKDENTLDISVLSEVVKDTSDIEELISFIQQRLDVLTSQQDPSTSQGNAGTSQELVVASKIESCVKFGRDLLDNVVKRVQRDTSCCDKSSFRVKLREKTRKLIIDMLKGSVKIHWLGVGLSVLGYVLEQIGQDFENKEQSVKLLCYMLALAEHVRQLNEKLPRNTEKLNDVIEFIVRGCVMCVSQMTNHSLFRFISASVNSEDIENFESELGQKYHDLTLEAVMALPHFLYPTQGQNPYAVGIIDARKTVTGLLQVEVKDQTKRAVVIYGFGGVGKTTLATAVFHHLHLKDNNYKFCRLDMEESCSSDHIKVLQQQLLLDLFGKNIMLRSHVEGRDQLTEEFSRARTQSVSVFMFIDNALKNDDLAKLLPSDLSCLPDQTRILLTTKNLEESSMFLKAGIQRYGYKVDCLKSKESKEILSNKALPSADDTFPQGVDIDGLVEICGGIPLVLEMVGSRLSEHYKDISICNEIIDSLKESLKEGEEETISERVVDVVYNSLNEDCKEAFLDIACFFHNQERSFVSYVVGELSLKTLENAALVKISHKPPTSKSSMRSARSAYSRWFEFVNGREGFLEVHDIVRARGRKLSQIQSDRRIMDVGSLAKAVQDPQNLQKIKGICITEGKSEFEIDAANLDLMHASLRTLYISGVKIKINGKCQKDFEKLRCIYLASNTSICMDLAKLKGLRVLRAVFSNNPNNPTEFPSSLRCLELKSVPHFQLSLAESFGKLSSLKELQLKNDVVLPSNFGHLKSLCLLKFYNCKMVTLPESFGGLSALEGLSIDECPKLGSLPMSFGELQKLAFLEVMDCPKLSSLSEGFGNLSSLKELCLEDCSNLVSLPNNFGRLKSLERLEALNCSNLKEEVMDILVKMKSLEGLCIEDSPMLIKRWKEVGEPLLASGHSLKLNSSILQRFCRVARIMAKEEAAAAGTPMVAVAAEQKSQIMAAAERVAAALAAARVRRAAAAEKAVIAEAEAAAAREAAATGTPTEAVAGAVAEALARARARARAIMMDDQFF